MNDWANIEMGDDHYHKFYTYEGERINPLTTTNATENSLNIQNGMSLSCRFPDGTEKVCWVRRYTDGRIVVLDMYHGVEVEVPLQSIQLRYGSMMRQKDY